MKIYTDKEASQKPLQGKVLAVLGYGSQGRAQAFSLRDSGLKVVVGLPLRSKSRRVAQKDGFRPLTVAKAVQSSQIISFLFPDHLHGEVFRKEIRPNLKAGQALVFAAGFSIHFKLVKPPKFVDVILVAPHSPGSYLRKAYLEGKGVPAFLAIAQDYTKSAKRIGLAYAKALRLTRSVVMETTFERETMGDLFGEQAVLCGGLSELVLAGYETLVQAGLPKENAYLETLHQLELLARLVKEKGIAGMHREISFLASWGSLKAGKRIIGRKTRKEMKRLLSEIKSGRFARAFLKDYQNNFKEYRKLLGGYQNLSLDKILLGFNKRAK